VPTGYASFPDDAAGAAGAAIRCTGRFFAGTSSLHRDKTTCWHLNKRGPA